MLRRRCLDSGCTTRGYKPEVSNRLERLLSMDAEIRLGRYPDVETLCRSYQIKSRTLFEDLRTLRSQLGLDIRFDRSRNGYYNATPSRRLPSFELTEDEFALLAL